METNREKLIEIVKANEEGRLDRYIAKYLRRSRNRLDYHSYDYDNTDYKQDIDKWPTERLKHCMSYVYSFSPTPLKRKHRLVIQATENEGDLRELDLLNQKKDANERSFVIQARNDFIDKRLAKRRSMIGNRPKLEQFTVKELRVYTGWIKVNITKYRGEILGNDLGIL